MNAHAVRRLAVEGGLRRALKQEEFLLHTSRKSILFLARSLAPKH